MAQLLVIEDEERIGAHLASGLTANGHNVTWRTTGSAALQAAHQTQFALVLLDLGLPDSDGIDICRQLRRLQTASVIVVLTARREEMDVVESLESGADDYLTKPFRMTELLARIRAHLRRSPAIDSAPETYLDGDLQLDLAARRCRIRGQEVSLRPKEFDLLARLAAEPDRAITREALMDEVWDQNWYGSTKTLDVHIAALRTHLTQATTQTNPPPKLPKITTLRGHGYRLDTVQAQTSQKL